MRPASRGDSSFTIPSASDGVHAKNLAKMLGPRPKATDGPGSRPGNVPPSRGSFLRPSYNSCDSRPLSDILIGTEEEVSEHDAQRKIQLLERKLAEVEAQLEGRQGTRHSTDPRLNRLLGDPVVLATFPHLILVLSRELRILYVNRAEPGLNPADFIGVDCLAAMHPEDRERYRAVCEEA